MLQSESQELQPGSHNNLDELYKKSLAIINSRDTEFYKALVASFQECSQVGMSHEEVIRHTVQKQAKLITSAIREALPPELLLHYKALNQAEREQFACSTITAHFFGAGVRPKYFRLVDSPENLDSIVEELSKKHPYDSPFYHIAGISLRSGHVDIDNHSELIKKAINEIIPPLNNLFRLWREEASSYPMQLEILTRYLKLIEKQPKKISWREKIRQLFSPS